MAASRLPDKVLLEIEGEPMLAWVLQRTRMAETIGQVVVATTRDQTDDVIAEFCAERGYACARGSAMDVLDRYYQTAAQFNARVIVRITADCPLIDPDLIDETVKALLDEKMDFAANRLPPPWGRTYPIGLDVEVFTFAALERAWAEAKKTRQREHVTPYFYEEVNPESLCFDPRKNRHAVGNSPRRFKVLLLHHDQDYGDLRWTVDTPQDLELVRQVISQLTNRSDFTWLDVLDIFERQPELVSINAQVQHKTHLDVDMRSSS
jgi:spore coat polysaccharide biosynthesis protein SpsF